MKSFRTHTLFLEIARSSKEDSTIAGSGTRIETERTNANNNVAETVN